MWAKPFVLQQLPVREELKELVGGSTAHSLKLVQVVDISSASPSSSGFETAEQCVKII